MKRSFIIGALALLFAPAAWAQTRLDSGQNIQPVYEGWVRLPDGSADLYFGYLNRNYREEVTIPIGPNNNITPEGPDRGQPTYFHTSFPALTVGDQRRQRYVFTVRVPKGWDPKREVVWTLTVHGQTDRAFGALNPEDEMIERNVLTTGNFDTPTPGRLDTNKPPTISAQATYDHVPLGEFDLAATIADDGLPKPRAARTTINTRDTTARTIDPDSSEPTSRVSGPRVVWIEYRGPAKARIAPTVPASPGTPSIAKVRFAAPGAYVFRAYAHDGQFRSLLPADVTVNVSAAQTRAGGSAVPEFENAYVRVAKNEAPCARAQPGTCEERVIVAMGDLEVRARGTMRKMARGDVAGFKKGDSYEAPVGEYYEITVKPNHPAAVHPPKTIAPTRNIMLYDDKSASFFVREEQLDPGESRPLHSHNTRLVIHLNAGARVTTSDAATPPPAAQRTARAPVAPRGPGEIVTWNGESATHSMRNDGTIALRNVVLEFR